MAKNKKKAVSQSIFVSQSSFFQQEIHLLEPRARTSAFKGVVNDAPCGGTERGNIHYMASQGSRNYIQWKTLKANKYSNCTVRVSTGSENAKDFQVLRPRDNSADW